MKEEIALIKVNGVDVGSMPLKDYETIVKTVRSDWRTRIAAALSNFTLIWRVITKLVKYFSLSYAAIFVFMMGYFYLHYAETVDFINSLRYASSESIADGIKLITDYSIIFSVIYYVLSLVIKGSEAQPYGNVR